MCKLSFLLLLLLLLCGTNGIASQKEDWKEATRLTGKVESSGLYKGNEVDDTIETQGFVVGHPAQLSVELTNKDKFITSFKVTLSLTVPESSSRINFTGPYIGGATESLILVNEADSSFMKIKRVPLSLTQNDLEKELTSRFCLNSSNFPIFKPRYDNLLEGTKIEYKNSLPSALYYGIPHNDGLMILDGTSCEFIKKSQSSYISENLAITGFKGQPLTTPFLFRIPEPKEKN